MNIFGLFFKLIIIITPFDLFFMCIIYSKMSTHSCFKKLPEIYKTGKGICYSYYRGTPPFFYNGAAYEPPTDSQLLTDLFLMNSAGFNLIRMYDLNDTVERILQLARKFFKCMSFQLGIPLNDPSTDDGAYNSLQIETAIRLANTYKNIVAVSVGNEVEYSTPGLTIAKQVEYVLIVKNNIKQPVTSDHVIEFYLGRNGSPDLLLQVIDFVAYHNYPSSDIENEILLPIDWQQTSVPIVDSALVQPRAIASMNAMIEHLKYYYKLLFNKTYIKSNGEIVTIGSTLPIVLTETGWKSTNLSFGGAPAPEISQYLYTQVNQKMFYDFAQKWIHSNKCNKDNHDNINSNVHPINMLVFETFDETWKEDDNMWGLWNALRGSKYTLCNAFCHDACNDPVYAGAGYYPKLSNVEPLRVVTADDAWLSYNNVFNVDQPGNPWYNQYQFGFQAPNTGRFVLTKPGEGTLNMNAFPYFWIEDGYFVLNGVPNKIVVQNFYVQNDNLIGEPSVTFSGKCLSNTLNVEPQTGFQYITSAFMSIFDSSYNLLYTYTVTLVTGQDFSITFDLSGPGISHFQYGFQQVGPVANPDNYKTLGELVVETVNPENQCIDKKLSRKLKKFLHCSLPKINHSQSLNINAIVNPDAQKAYVDNLKRSNRNSYVPQNKQTINKLYLK